MKEKISKKFFFMNILNGVAIGTVLALVPGALFGEILKYLSKMHTSLSFLATMTTISNSMVGLIAGIMVDILFKFSPIQTASLGLATLFAGGSIISSVDKTSLILKGTGDIVTIIFTAIIATGLILLIGDKTKNYAILVIPTTSLIIAGGIGRFFLPYFSKITGIIGNLIKHLLTLQPFLLTIIIAIIFACLIVSPITSVGIALAINIDGIASGAANLGICACGFTLAIAGWTVNSKGVSISHFIGSPKISMANIFKKPIIILPVLCSAACSGLMAAIFNIQGTSMSAGFGLSGLVGPIAYYSISGFTIGTILKSILVFIIIPIISGFTFIKLFTKVVPIIKIEDYKIKL